MSLRYKSTWPYFPEVIVPKYLIFEGKSWNSVFSIKLIEYKNIKNDWTQILQAVLG